MATVALENGIDVDRLVETIDAIKEDPDLGAFTFRAKRSWLLQALAFGFSRQAEFARG